jgi:hypothetical protein
VNGTTLERPDVAAYLDAVRARLSDLPAEERDDLVADVEASLLESGEPPTLSPDEFAAELREAAGLNSAEPPGRGALATLQSWLSTARARSLRRTATELAPIWWLARAHVVVVLVALASGQGWPVGSGTSNAAVSVETSAFVVLVTAAVSIWLGVRGRRRAPARRRLGLVANVALALTVLPVAAYSLDQLSDGPYVTYFAAEPVPGLANNGQAVRNLYPYSRDGRLLHDVLLYDERGLPVPIMIGFDDPLRRVLERPDGRQVRNSYPIRYYEPGTKWVARPNLAPGVDVPEIVTPPLSEQSDPPDR